MADDMFTLDRRRGRDRRNPERSQPGRRGSGKSRRVNERTAAGISAGWALIALDERKTVGCWIMNESKAGFALETREAHKGCPIEVGTTYWVQIKPSLARKSSWVAANVRHIKEKGFGTGVFKVGLQVVTTAPPELGATPRL